MAVVVLGSLLLDFPCHVASQGQAAVVRLHCVRQRRQERRRWHTNYLQEVLVVLLAYLVELLEESVVVSLDRFEVNA